MGGAFRKGWGAQTFPLTFLLPPYCASTNMDTASPMTLRFRPTLRARIALPPSKSISARALIVQAYAGQDGMVAGLSDCDDTRAMWLPGRPGARKANTRERKDIRRSAS